MKNSKKRRIGSVVQNVRRPPSAEAAFSLTDGHIRVLAYREDASFGFYAFLKRLGDVLVSFLSILLLALPMLLVAVAVRCESAGPAFFRQIRVGRGGRLFTVYKFRTMVADAPHCSSARLTMLGRERYVTRMGRILRRTGLDELPQLFNVLCGEMSLIGPRPVIPEEVELVRMRVSLGVSDLRPGITGLAQVSGRDDRTPEEKAALDALYARTLSPLTDLRILLLTARTVFLGTGCN